MGGSVFIACLLVPTGRARGTKPKFWFFIPEQGNALQADMQLLVHT